MITLFEIFLMGIFATFFMDVTARLLIKSKIVRPTLEPQVVGRWALYMIKGKFVHKDIRLTPALKNEMPAAFLAHYLIGTVLAGIYFCLELSVPAIRSQPWASLIFGVTTSLLPWLWLYPAIGIGYLASKSQNKSNFIILSIINHLNFGIGMTIWIVILRRFFV
jgi:lipid-A-disaccharide synthase-like uncharacterized protein